jgi:hypothetical protein
MKKMLNEGNQTHNFISSSGSGTVIFYGSGSGGSDFLASSGSGSTSLKVTVPTVPVPVPQHCFKLLFIASLFIVTWLRNRGPRTLRALCYYIIIKSSISLPIPARCGLNKTINRKIIDKSA